jgi:hypothetical protein
MSDPRKQPAASSDLPGSRTAESGGEAEDLAIFSDSSEEEPASRGMLIAIVAAAVIAILGGLFVLRGRDSAAAYPPNTILPKDAYAPSLVFSQLAMSQSSSLSGGTSTFLDGRVRNTGPSTITAATVQVIFRNDVGLSPEVESLPLSLIRTREPYVDTEPVSAAPIKPGDEVEFRLIFETIPDNWNQQMPEIQVVHVSLR